MFVEFGGYRYVEQNGRRSPAAFGPRLGTSFHTLTA